MKLVISNKDLASDSVAKQWTGLAIALIKAQPLQTNQTSTVPKSTIWDMVINHRGGNYGLSFHNGDISIYSFDHSSTTPALIMGGFTDLFRNFLPDSAVNTVGDALFHAGQRIKFQRLKFNFEAQWPGMQASNTKAMNIGWQMINLALCTWKLYELHANSEEASRQLNEYLASLHQLISKTEQDNANLTVYVKQTDEIISTMMESIDNLTSTISENAETLNSLVAGFNRDAIMTTAQTKTTPQNAVSRLDRITQLFRSLQQNFKAYYNSVRFSIQVSADVHSNIGVDGTLKALKSMRIVKTSYDVFSKIAATTKRVLYDGVNLLCIRQGVITSQSMLDNYVSRMSSGSMSIPPQRIIKAIEALMMSNLPLLTIRRSIISRQSVTLTKEQILQVIANSASFLTEPTYPRADPNYPSMARSFNLAEYRLTKSSC